MKVVFVNPPVFRYLNRSPHDDLRVLLGRLTLSKSKFIRKIANKLKLGKGLRWGIRAGSRWPWTDGQPVWINAPYPFFLGYSAALLKSKDFDINIVEYIVRNNTSYRQFIREVKNEKADIVVLECSTPTVDIDVWMAKKISYFSQVALAGPHITTNYQKMQKDYPFVTYWLPGEYILSSLKMAQTRKPGVYQPEIVKDLDSIPFPFRDYKGGHDHYEITMPTAKPQLQIYAAKGCPFHCVFCSWPQTMYMHTVAQRRPEKIMEEIRENAARFGYKSILFDDDTFNVGEERTRTLCDGLKEIGLPWTMMGRLDCSSKETFDKMIESGCVGLRLGVETFNIDVLKRIKKGIERMDFLGTLEHLAKTYPNVWIHLTMMKDLPGQTEEIHAKDLRILHDLKFTPHDVFRSYQLSSCVPFPGTELYYQLLEEGNKEKLENFSLYDGQQETVMKKIK